MSKGNNILKLKSVISNVIKSMSGQDEIKKHDKNLDYYHNEKDPKTNAETTPPDDEKIDALDDFQDTLHDMRHRAAGGGWINLG